MCKQTHYRHGPLDRVGCLLDHLRYLAGDLAGLRHSCAVHHTTVFHCLPHAKGLPMPAMFHDNSIQCMARWHQIPGARSNGTLGETDQQLAGQANAVPSLRVKICHTCKCRYVLIIPCCSSLCVSTQLDPASVYTYANEVVVKKHVYMIWLSCC